ATADGGHCPIDYAVGRAAETGARRVALYHHDPLHDDDMLDSVAERYAHCRSGLEVIVAREGLAVRLGA
ncbi:MAG: hypothetical protein ACO307_09640, partial [Ilumatobacteraceae bacterium]